GRFLAGCVSLIAVALLAPAIVNGQAKSSPARTGGGTYVQPKTSWGDPDIQGIWNNVTATPLQRPDELKDKAVLSSQEAAEYEARLADRQAKAEARPHTGYAASVWFETSHTLSENRTALLVPPEGGGLPPLTPTPA